MIPEPRKPIQNCELNFKSIRRSIGGKIIKGITLFDHEIRIGSTLPEARLINKLRKLSEIGFSIAKISHMFLVLFCHIESGFPHRRQLNKKFSSRNLNNCFVHITKYRFYISSLKGFHSSFRSFFYKYIIPQGFYIAIPVRDEIFIALYHLQLKSL